MAKRYVRNPDQIAQWKAAVSAHNKAKRSQRWKRPPKPITGIRIMSPAERNDGDHGDTGHGETT